MLVENFRPGVLEKWGLGPDALLARNPRLVVLRVTGFGQDGPYAERRAFGTLMEAMSGFAHQTGQEDGPPTLPPFGLADGVAGIAGAYAVLTALYHRDRRDGSGGGRGQVIDLALLEPLLGILGPGPTVYDQLGIIAGRHGNRSPNNAPRNAYLTRDGRWVAISASATSIAGGNLLTLHARSHLVVCSRAAGIAPPIDSVFPHLADEAELRAQAEFARSLGFFGKSAIHPRQLPVLHAVFTPTERELAWAREVVAAFDAAGGDAVALPDGEFVDLPVAQRARRLLRA